MMWENDSYLSSNLCEPIKKEIGAQSLGSMTSQYSQQEISKTLNDIFLEVTCQYSIPPKYIHGD